MMVDVPVDIGGGVCIKNLRKCGRLVLSEIQIVSQEKKISPLLCCRCRCRRDLENYPAITPVARQIVYHGRGQCVFPNLTNFEEGASSSVGQIVSGGGYQDNLSDLCRVNGSPEQKNRCWGKQDDPRGPPAACIGMINSV